MTSCVLMVFARVCRLQSHTKLHPGSIVALEMHPYNNSKVTVLEAWNFIRMCVEMYNSLVVDRTSD